MPRARRGLWRRERAGIDASSMTVKPACNGKSCRKSWSMLLELPPALHHTTAGLPPDHELGNTALLARLLRLTCRLHSGTEKNHLRATVKVAMDEEHAREQERVSQPNGSARGRGGGKKFPSDPLT